MISINIGGVPEHFNLPFRLLLDDDRGRALGVDARWCDYPEGSGAMATALRAGQLDAAVLLTEGAVAGIGTGGGFKIAGLYVESPLLWGIHVPAASRYEAIQELETARYAISRRGSGSHLMAFVHARERGWNTAALRLVEVGNLEGAVEAFAAGRADVFFWEKFMTKPLVDAGRFRRIGEFVAPWPAFVLCVGDSTGPAQRAAIAKLYEAGRAAAQRLAAQRDAATVIADRYGLQAGDVAEWLRATRWATRAGVDVAVVEPVVAALAAVGLIRSDFTAADALDPL